MAHVGNLSMCRLLSEYLALRKLTIHKREIAIETDHLCPEIKAIEEGIYGARHDAD
jgi:hypothetical protein